MKKLNTNIWFLFKNYFQIGNVQERKFNNMAPDRYKNNSIDPNYISGLTQADGSFSCGIEKIENKQRLRFRPKFELVVDLNSKNALYKIQEYFSCGEVILRSSDHSARFIVTNLDDLRKFIIPHFKNYPVFFNKLHAFNLFTNILELLTKKHKNRDNLLILRLAISMNPVSRRTEEQIQEFSLILGNSQPIIKINNNIKNQTSELTMPFLCGMIDGDGSFNIIFVRPNSHKIGKIIPQLTICFSLSCLPLIEASKKYLGKYGVLEKTSSIYILRIRNLNEIINNVIPFMDSNQIYTQKKEHYEI